MTHSVGTLLERLRPIATSVIVTLGLLMVLGNNWAAADDPPPRGGDLSCVSWGANRLDCFMRGTDGQLNHKWYAGAGWQGWQSYNGLIASDPACVSWGVNRIDCVARGTDNAMYHTWWNGDQRRVWENIGGVFASANPACVSWGPNRLDCFARGDDGQMYHKWWDGSRWGGWEALGGVFGAGDPTCVSWEAHRLDCFARGDDSVLYHKWWDGSRWRGWESLGGTLLTKPACVAWGVGRLECFTKGTDGAMWHRRFDGGRWQNWESLGGIITTDPACVSWGQNRIDCVARGTDNTLYHRWWDGTSWLGWEPVGGVILSNPACTSWGPNRLDCFAWGNEGVVHNAWNEPAAPQRWGGWVVLGKDVGSRPSQQQLDGERGWLTTTTVGNTTTYRIDEPNVKAKLTHYPEVTFAPGDRVTIAAGGCAQSGGIGDTWHRYVQSNDLYYGTILIPSIEGAVAGMEAAPPRLSQVTGTTDGVPGRTFVLPEPAQGLQLSLGFVDNKYSDNGYWEHDDGPGGQCRGIGNAYVIITKTPGPVPSPSYAPFDVVFNDPKEPYDDNGLLLNPVWGWQKSHDRELPPVDGAKQHCGSAPWKSPCTAQTPAADTWDATVGAILAGLDYNWHLATHPLDFFYSPRSCGVGHQNWMPVTYTGHIYWESHSPNFNDDDYNFRMVTPSVGTNANGVSLGAGVVDTNHFIYPTTGEIAGANGGVVLYPIDKTPVDSSSVPQSLGLEFNSDETIDYFTTRWWSEFHDKVDAANTGYGYGKDCYFKQDTTICSGNPQRCTTVVPYQAKCQALGAVQSEVNGKYAIVSGLFGLDCAHDCSSELHPVYAMAIRVKDDPSDEVWEIFVRRRGDEGFCSQHQHLLENLPSDTYTFRLPSSGTSVEITQAEFLTRSGGPAMVSFPVSDLSKGKLVSFHVPPPHYVPPTGLNKSDKGHWKDDMIHGELRLHWSGTHQGLPANTGIIRQDVTSIQPSIAPDTDPTPTPSEDSEMEAEAALSELVEAMSPAEQAVFFSKIPPKTITKHSTSVPTVPAPVVGAPGAIAERRELPRVTAVIDPTRQLKDQQLMEALNAALPHLAPIQPSAPVTPSPTGSISGKVINGTTQEPLVEKVIRVKGSEIFARTDNKGNFTLEGMPEGSQTVLFNITGFHDGVTRTVTVVPGRPVSVGTVTMLVRTFTGTLIGKVIVDDMAQAPIQGATVAVTVVATGASFQKPTDGVGNFTFSDVPAGFITITVSKPGFTSKTLPGQVKEDRTGNAGTIRLAPN